MFYALHLFVIDCDGKLSGAYGGQFHQEKVLSTKFLFSLSLDSMIISNGGGIIITSPPPQWAKIMVHSTLIKYIYENGQIYEQNIDKSNPY